RPAVGGKGGRAATGPPAGRFAAAERRGLAMSPPPATTALGALLGHITGGADAATFQPMNVNFGLFPPLAPSGRRPLKGRDRRQALAGRALAELALWLDAPQEAAE